MKDFSGSKSLNEDVGILRDFSVRLSAHVADWVEQAARTKGKTTEQFLQELVLEILEEQAEPLEARLQRLDALVRRLVVLANKMPMQEEKDAKTGSRSLEERKRKREHLVEIGLEAFDELRKIAASEQASKEAESRLQAFTVMARLGKFNAAVIHDQEADEIARLLEEVEAANQEYQAKRNEREKKRREEEEEERERWRAAPV